VGWSGFSEQGLAVAKKHGAVTILERGAAHIEYQRDILEEEYDLHGGKPHLPHIRLIEKECREYAIADYISVPSLFVRQTFVDRGVPSDKLLVNPYGVDLGQFHQQPKLDNVFRVIFVGAMSLQKGVHYLLQAFYELQLPRAELWLVGAKQPEIEPFFTKYAGSFRYLGSVPQGELYRLYSQCSVFVICSIQDGFGMVVSQAMSCGLPIICTFNTGSRDLIHEGREGFIVPIRDVEALKEKLGYLYANQELGIEMGQAAKRRVGFGLTWTDYGNRAAAMYERLLLCHI
jgi:glycosyltransferase involved in cell wall biosynthesis